MMTIMTTTNNNENNDNGNDHDYGIDNDSMKYRNDYMHEEISSNKHLLQTAWSSKLMQ